MKKLLTILMGIIFMTSLIGPVMAQEKAKKEEPAPAGKPAAEKSTEAATAKEPQEKAKAEEQKMAAPKPMTWRAGGVVSAVDAKTKTLSIHQETLQHERVLKLKGSEKVAKEFSTLMPGDLVNIWITDGIVTALDKVG